MNIIGRYKLKHIGEKRIAEANFVPEDYRHTRAYLLTVVDVEGDIRRRLGRIPCIDPFSYDTLDGELKTECAAEIRFGKEQHIKHLTVIKHMADIISAKVNKAQTNMEHLCDDMHRAQEEEQKLIDLRDEYEHRKTHKKKGDITNE